MENIRNWVDVRLVNENKKARKLPSKINFKHLRIFEILYNKTVYVKMSILELLTTLIHDFHYNEIKRKHGARSKFLSND